jgi:hypothetical protein
LIQLCWASYFSIRWQELTNLRQTRKLINDVGSVEKVNKTEREVSYTGETATQQPVMPSYTQTQAWQQNQ